MDLLSRSFSDRMRRNSFSSVTVKLNFFELEQFIHFLASEYTQDPEIAVVAQENFCGLAARFGSSSSSSSLSASMSNHDDELNEIVEIFGAILNDAAPHQELPPKIVAQIHSYVGLLRVQQGRYTRAIQSYLKALWLQTSSARDSVDVAVTENRLGLAYGMSGNLPQAISLLEKSLEHYDKAGMRQDHFVVEDAQTALLDFRSRHLQKTLHKQVRCSTSQATAPLPGLVGASSVRRLSHIQEDLAATVTEFHQSVGNFGRW